MSLHSSEKKGEDAVMVMLQKTRVYKILGASDWAHAEQVGHTETALDEGDGYVHLSTRAQVAETLALHYAGAPEVRLLEYIAEHMSGPIRWEESRGGQLFPHLYAPLRPDAAERVWTLSLNQHGIPQLPPDIDA
ncbi:MAG: DUF952 domain-containing protein [Pseudomonadota bacterium]